MKTIVCKILFFLKCAAPVPAPVVQPPAPAVRALSATCTVTSVPNNTCPTCVDLILSSGCTAADLFVNAAAGDFHVPTLDAPEVNRAQCLAEVLTDADGRARPTPGRGCDVGAYQYQTPPNTPPPAPTGLTVISITR